MTRHTFDTIEPVEGSPEWHDIHHNGRAFTRDWVPVTGHDTCDWDVCVDYRDGVAGEPR